MYQHQELEEICFLRAAVIPNDAVTTDVETIEFGDSRQYAFAYMQDS